MSVWLVHPTGNQSFRAVLRALESARVEPWLFTTVAFNPVYQEMWSKISPALGAELARRTFPEIPFSRIRQFPTREVIRQVAARLRLSALIRHETGLASTDRVYRGLDQAVAAKLHCSQKRPRAVYCYEDGALLTFEEASRCGVRRLYELPTTYWRWSRRLFEEEKERRARWSPTLDGLRDSREKLERKDRELSEADLVVVPSSFVAESLALAPRQPKRIAVIPYGCAPPSDAPISQRRPDEPLRVLYAGKLSQAKGLADLFEALDRLTVPHLLTLAGPCPWPDCEPLRRALARPGRKWVGAVPHPVLMRLMREHHVLVFPSLLEGFGLVLTEAMANGLPFIATPHTAAPKLLSTNGGEGFVVPIRDPDAIAERLTFLYENEEERRAMAEAAKRRAVEMSWRNFEDRIAALVRQFVQ